MQADTEKNKPIIQARIVQPFVENVGYENHNMQDTHSVYYDCKLPHLIGQFTEAFFEGLWLVVARILTPLAAAEAPTEDYIKSFWWTRRDFIWRSVPAATVLRNVL